MDKSFFIVSKKGDSPVRRAEMISEICQGTDNSYKTEYPHIVKLCRTCIADVCKELTVMINWETSRFKKFSEVREQLASGSYPYPVQDHEALVEDLEVSITDAKYLYNQYHQLYQELKKKKLYTKACVVCTGLSKCS